VTVLLVLLARAVIGLIQALPLNGVARLGRFLGAMAWHLDRRHRRVALENLTAVFGRERSPEEIRQLARENFLRLGEAYACGLKTAAMSDEAIASRVDWVDIRRLQIPAGKSIVAAIGHFGNFEVFARARSQLTGHTVATTYRALRQPALNRLFQTIRQNSGVRYFERRTEAGALRDAFQSGGLILGLLADQHAGDRGLWLPFFGRDCSCSPAPAVYALRYKTPLISGFCFRTGLGRWRVEFHDAIPTHGADGAPRSLEDITRDINTVFEAAIRRDPANWFWVHRRWKPASRFQQNRAASGNATEPLPEDG
jgi:lauroyl/myristoyl acyltransferase